LSTLKKTDKKRKKKKKRSRVADVPACPKKKNFPSRGTHEIGRKPGSGGGGGGGSPWAEKEKKSHKKGGTKTGPIWTKLILLEKRTGPLGSLKLLNTNKKGVQGPVGEKKVLAAPKKVVRVIQEREGGGQHR